MVSQGTGTQQKTNFYDHLSFILRGAQVGYWFTVTPLKPFDYKIFPPGKEKKRKKKRFVHAEHTYIHHAVHIYACLKVPMKFDIKMGQILKVRTCSRLRPSHVFGFWVDGTAVTHSTHSSNNNKNLFHVSNWGLHAPTAFL